MYGMSHGVEHGRIANHRLQLTLKACSESGIISLKLVNKDRSSAKCPARLLAAHALLYSSSNT